MKKFKIVLLVAMLLPAMLNAKAKVYESEKVVNHSFPASSNHTLSVDNKYGVILVEQWDKNEVHATVTIVGKSARSQASADDLVNRIKINATANGNNIILRTEFESNTTVKTRGNTTVTKTVTESQGNEINYLIKVPRNISFNLTNKYGDITVDECGNKTAIDIKYGDLNCTKMTSKNNSLTIGYGDASIQEVNSIVIDMKYSNLSFGNVASLNLTSKYSNIKADAIDNLTATAGYDNYKIKEIGKTTIDAKYTTIKVSKISDNCSMLNKYGNITVNDVDAKVKSLDFELGYTSLAININPKINYELDAYAKYGNITLPNDIASNIKHRDTSGNSTTIKGTFGSGTPGLKIKATNSYADIKLTAK